MTVKLPERRNVPIPGDYTDFVYATAWNHCLEKVMLLNTKNLTEQWFAASNDGKVLIRCTTKELAMHHANIIRGRYFLMREVVP